jgi:hypothetical protein
MALWQYDIYLTPQARLLKVCGDLPAKVTDEQRPALHWNTRYQPPRDYADRLSAFLPVSPGNEAWSEYLQAWGSPDSNWVGVWSVKGRVTSIFVRLDARHGAASPVLPRIVAFAQHCDAVFLTDGGHIIAPTVRPLLAVMERSPVRHFVTHPPSKPLLYHPD